MTVRTRDGQNVVERHRRIGRDNLQRRLGKRLPAHPPNDCSITVDVPIALRRDPI